MVGADRAAANMRRVIEVMRDETAATLVQPQRSLGGFLNGEARRVDQNRALYAPSLLGCTLTEAAARAMAVLERSATMGVIVAAPTAGSAGVVPGCVLAVAPLLAQGRDEIDKMIAERAERTKKTVEEIREKTNIPALKRTEAIRRAADWVIEHSTIEEK